MLELILLITILVIVVAQTAFNIYKFIREESDFKQYDQLTNTIDSQDYTIRNLKDDQYDKMKYIIYLHKLLKAEDIGYVDEDDFVERMHNDKELEDSL